MKPSDYQFMIDEIERSQKRLRPYDKDFVESMQRLIGMGRRINGNQGNYLQNLYTRCTEPKRLKWGSAVKI